MKPKTTISNQVHNLEIAMQLVVLLDSDLGMSSLDDLYLTSWARAVHLADELIDGYGPEHFTDEEEEYIIASYQALAKIGEVIREEQDMDGA